MLSLVCPQYIKEIAYCINQMIQSSPVNTKSRKHVIEDPLRKGEELKKIKESIKITNPQRCSAQT